MIIPQRGEERNAKTGQTEGCEVEGGRSIIIVLVYAWVSFTLRSKVVFDHR
jgi:hypothetical protein